jgi:hypothetical protein
MMGRKSVVVPRALSICIDTLYFFLSGRGLKGVRYVDKEKAKDHLCPGWVEKPHKRA